MKHVAVLATVLALAIARPEMYKEKEDFQYSRSSSDDGSKSGYYGAQRGNMGGNYERAHNMDSLAQNQMSGLVRQVEGELGDGAKTRAGRVYSSAKSSGTYGSGHYDLSNLAGRNFEEGTSYDNSQSHSSLSQSSFGFNNAGHSRSQHSSYSNGYQAGDHLDSQALQSEGLQSLDNLQAANQFDLGHKSHSSGYSSQSGYQKHSEYDSSNLNSHGESSGLGSNIHTRLISGTPVRIIVRPGTTIAVPVAAQTYDTSHGSLSSYNHNALTSEAEVLGTSFGSAYKPVNPKQYESSYSYRKEWEKHGSLPATVIVPTSSDNPIPTNSELYEDRSESSNSGYSGYNSNIKSSSSHSRYRSNYNENQLAALSRSNSDAYSSSRSDAVSGSGSNTVSESGSNAYVKGQYRGNTRYQGSLSDSHNAYQAGHNSDLNSQVESLSGKPKSYQSSYSYHKSWERQGDPYVIKPAGIYDGQSQRFTSATKNMGYASHSHQGEDCDENGHIRVARSYNPDKFYPDQEIQQQSQNLFDGDLGQQVQTSHQNLEDFGQLVQSNHQNLEDFGQQTQTNHENLENFGQQTQTHWDPYDAGQQSLGQGQNNWEKYKDIGQRPVNTNNFENLQQQSQFSHNVEQQSQNQHELIQDDTKYDQNTHFETFDKQTHDDGVQTYEGNNNPQVNTHRLIENKTADHSTNLWDSFDIHSVIKPLHENDSQVEKSSSSLTGIWDKIDSFDHLSQTSNIHDIPHSQTNEQRVISSNIDSTSSQESSKDYESQSKDEKETNKDIGRGDISPEDSKENDDEKNDSSLMNNLGKQNTHNRPKQYSYNNNQQVPTEHQIIEDFSQRQNVGLQMPFHFGHSESVVEKIFEYENQHKQIVKNVTSQENLDQQNLEIFGQQEMQNEHNWRDFSKEKLDQQSMQDFGSQQIENKYNLHDFAQHENFDQQNIPVTRLEETQNGQDLHDFGQHENLDQQNMQDFRSHKTQNKYNLYDFSQHENVDQQNMPEIKPQETQNEQDLHDFAQHENLDQQNMQDTRSQESLNKYNLHDFSQHENVDQKNMPEMKPQETQNEQNLHDFAQHENLDQQNMQDTRSQESQNKYNLHDFSQHENVDQQNMPEIKPQETQNEQNLHDFSQHKNFYQLNMQDFRSHQTQNKYNLHDLTQRENVDQQNMQESRLLKTQTEQDFNQRENLDQQNLQGFRDQSNTGNSKPDNTDLQAFDQIEAEAKRNHTDIHLNKDIEQQNIHDIAQHETKDQQNFKQSQHNSENLQLNKNFGQQSFIPVENVDQDNLEKNENQHTNQEQYNLHSIEQLETLGQINLQDFGQSESQYQQNLDKIASENLSQQSYREYSPVENFELQNTQNVQTENWEKFVSQTVQNLQQPKNSEHVFETLIPPSVNKENNDMEPKVENNDKVVLPIEPVTEKPSFWKSVGSKFSSAKDKVVSWFKS